MEKRYFLLPFLSLFLPEWPLFRYLLHSENWQAHFHMYFSFIWKSVISSSSVVNGILWISTKYGTWYNFPLDKINSLNDLNPILWTIPDKYFTSQSNVYRVYIRNKMLWPLSSFYFFTALFEIFYEYELIWINLDSIEIKMSWARIDKHKESLRHVPDSPKERILVVGIRG